MISRVATFWKSPVFFDALESLGILFISPGMSLKISGSFPVLHWDRIVKLLSLINKHKKIKYVKE